MPLPVPVSHGLTVTNPLVLYRTLLALKKIDPDPAQHRLALELQKVYFRLKDYSPAEEYSARLQAINKAIRETPSEDGDERTIAVPGHPLRRNPLFSHLFPKTEKRDSLALTRILTSHETAMTLNSPKGFLLHGEVGTGKSMLLDLLADSLPNPKKRRWHFNTFMLETISRLEHLRQSRSTGEDSEYSMVWLAKEMIEKSPILFLDEFQLPDRAASKLLSNLFTPFFQLGGVLIASSNRMPDELAKASGMDFTAPSRGGLVKHLLGIGGGSPKSKFQANNEYGQFVDVLKARCDIWDMSGGRDWRRREAEIMSGEDLEAAEILREDIMEGFPGWGKSDRSVNDQTEDDATIVTLKDSLLLPNKYFLQTTESRIWDDTLRTVVPPGTISPIPWEVISLSVYGRNLIVPQCFAGVASWSFASLCAGPLGPADYITLASTFHTIILDEVPILSVAQKNEARRFITLLDALYEARCKLIIRAAAGPDDIFFPEAKVLQSSNESHLSDSDQDAVYPETLAEIYQDQTSPFRPNISSYTAESRAGYDPDEDSDFGPVLSKSSVTGHGVDFGMTSSFTGEDERFAYKRASSRLWEMCGTRWHARSGEDWWKPLPIDLRRWERIQPTVKSSDEENFAKQDARIVLPVESDVKLGVSIELDQPAGLQRGQEGHSASHKNSFQKDQKKFTSVT